MLDNFVVSVLAHWENYEEMYLMQDAVPPYFSPSY
jgi:hypothetical protein